MVIANLLLLPLYKAGEFVEVVKAGVLESPPGPGNLPFTIFMTFGPLLSVYVVVFFFYFLALKQWPRVFRHIGSLEEKVTDVFSKHK